jgi:CheY-like chemotaxis protein
MEDALQRAEPLRIVALTATAMRQDRLAAQLAGIDEFLCKPYRTESLVALLAPSVHRLRV